MSNNQTTPDASANDQTPKTTTTDTTTTPAPKKNFFEKAAESLEGLVTLEINTVVGNFSFTDKGEDLHVNLDDPKVDKMISRINLLSGDITTAMTDKFVTEYADLRKYHATREQEGHAIIEKNLGVVKKISETIIKLIEDNKKKDDAEAKLNEGTPTEGTTTES